MLPAKDLIGGNQQQQTHASSRLFGGGARVYFSKSGW